MTDSERGDNGIFGDRPDEEIYEAFPQRPMAYGMDPTDGMPRPAVSSALKDAYAPPLTPATLVCMADTSEFVRRDEWGVVTHRWDPKHVERMPNGKWRARAKDATPRYPLPRWKLMRCTGYVTVEPIRPQCRHYARQMTDFQDDPEAKFVARLCTARRNSEEGFLSVRDAQVFACELRVPSDHASRENIDAFDEKKIALGEERLKAPEEFDVEAELSKQRNEDQ